MADEHAPDHAGHVSSGSDRDEHAGHTRGHDQGHGPKGFGLAFAVGVFLNTGFVIVEAVYGLLSNSMALLADAGHNFSDVLGLLIAWGATFLAKRKPGGRYSYGLRSSSIVAALPSCRNGRRNRSPHSEGVRISSAWAAACPMPSPVPMSCSNRSE